MNQYVDLTAFGFKDFLHCDICSEKIKASMMNNTLGLLFTGGAYGQLAGIDWTVYQGFYFDICANASHNGRFVLAFWRTGMDVLQAPMPDVAAVFGVLPGCTTRIWFDLSWLDGQQVHIRRTPGRLKMSITASMRFEIKDIGFFAIAAWKAPTVYDFTIENFTLSTEEPDFPYANVKLLDELGQWCGKDWPGKTQGVQEMISNLQSRYEEALKEEPKWGVEGLDKWGGLCAKKLTEGTGFFATHHDGRRWWLADPDGNAFLSVGPDCVGACDAWAYETVMAQHLTWSPSSEKDLFADAVNKIPDYLTSPGSVLVNFEMANFIRAFGKEWKKKYAAIAKKDIMRWGWNTIANWSDPELFSYMQMPYVIPMPAYPSTEKTIFRSFPDVFSDAFSKAAIHYAGHLEAYRDDPYLLGYFMSNEPDWAYIEDLNVAEQLLNCPHDLESKHALAVWLEARYGTIHALNDAWNVHWESFQAVHTPVREAAKFSPAAQEDLWAFTRVLLRRYLEIPAIECRRVDPHHLNLGMRWASVSSEAVMEGWDIFDVFSLNHYGMCPVEEVNRIAQIVDRPILIGEFHFGALDVGMPATGMKGVTSQLQRGVAYRYYVENAMAHPAFVGAHWFVFEDQNALGRADGENLNIGVWDVCGKPYAAFVKGLRLANQHIYEIADAKRMPTRQAAEEIPTIFA